LVRKLEKCSSLSHGEEPNICAKHAAENFDRYVTQMMCQNYSRQDLFQDTSALKALAFRAVFVEYTNSMLARFRVRETVLASDSSSEFPKSKATLMVFVAGKKPA